MDTKKLNFISTQFTQLVKTLAATATGKWGKMNAQQMTEHVAAFFKVSTEKIIFALQTPVEHLPKYKEFLLSDKAFRENTKGPESILPEEPFPLRNNSFAAATDELQNEINDFVQFFKDNPERKTVHPVFGELNFEEWVLLHYKHVTHHARQFGLMD
jgi:hypothetical protein